MSFWLISLKEKGIERLLFGESRCYGMFSDRYSGCRERGTYDLEGFAGHSRG